MDLSFLHQSPVVVAITGPNGAGKTTFFRAHLLKCGLPYINADDLAKAFGWEAYAAAKEAARVRERFIEDRRSFAFETVFSDPVGDKAHFLQSAKNSGYAVLLCFIWIASAEMSKERVAMRVASGGHNVPADKLIARYQRTLENLKLAIESQLNVLVFDNSNLADPYRQVAAFQNGEPDRADGELPGWLRDLLGSYPRSQ
jgi:predicted ABC-type ATPase